MENIPDYFDVTTSPNNEELTTSIADIDVLSFQGSGLRPSYKGTRPYLVPTSVSVEPTLRQDRSKLTTDNPIDLNLKNENIWQY